MWCPIHRTFCWDKNLVQALCMDFREAVLDYLVCENALTYAVLGIRCAVCLMYICFMHVCSMRSQAYSWPYTLVALIFRSFQQTNRQWG